MSEGADGMRKRLFRGDHVSAAESAAKPPVSAGSVATQAAEPAPVLAKQQSVAPPVPEKMLRPDNVFRKHIEHEEQPRQVVMLMLMLVPFIYLAVFAPISEDTGALKKNITHCFFAVVGVASCWGAVSLPDGLMVRPHPMMWRIVGALSLLYCLIMAALLTQDMHDVRKFLMLMFDDISPPKTDVWSMAKDCSITRVTIMRQINSIWFLSHALGWIFKMLMMRDWRLCWIQSVFFELIEITLQFLIPDFQECWWDSIFIDCLGANFVGMSVGWLVLSILNRCCNIRHKFNWSGKTTLKDTYKPTSPVVRFVWKCTPFSWPSYHWGAFTSFSRLLMNMPVILGPLLVETNVFFIMHCLWIQPTSKIVIVRLLVICLLCYPGIAEWYEYTINPAVKRIGPNSWLLMSVILLETLLNIKMGRQEFTKVIVPAEIYLPWVGFFALLSLWALLTFAIFPRKATTPEEEAKRRWDWKDLLFFLSFTPLLLLGRLWKFA